LIFVKNGITTRNDPKNNPQIITQKNMQAQAAGAGSRLQAQAQ
jgi:hypothetical protein